MTTLIPGGCVSGINEDYDVLYAVTFRSGKI
jgi:hypothetical protein